MKPPKKIKYRGVTYVKATTGSPIEALKKYLFSEAWDIKAMLHDFPDEVTSVAQAMKELATEEIPYIHGDRSREKTAVMEAILKHYLETQVNWEALAQDPELAQEIEDPILGFKGKRWSEEMAEE